MLSDRSPVIVQSITPSSFRSFPLPTLVIRHSGAGSTTSVATTAMVTGTVWSVSGRRVTLGVTLLIAGAVLSRTVIAAWSEPVLPKPLVAEQTTVVAPSGNIDPDAGAQVTGSVPKTTSVAVAA